MGLPAGAGLGLHLCQLFALDAARAGIPDHRGCHALLEPSVTLSPRDWMLVVLCGLGPLGAAFFFWDLALKRGDARQIGILSYLTPLASTALLMVVTGRALSWSIALAAVLIISAAVMGTRAR